MNNVNPKVTVRMSAYNHEKYVEQAILSIVNQTFQDFELLVIDDGSSDQTPEILERLSQQYGFYFERQENMGLPMILNKLISMAKGEYITGCASDDIYPQRRLEEQVAEMDANPDVGLIHGLASTIDGDGNQINREFHSFDLLLDGDQAYFDAICLRRHFVAPTQMLRTSVYTEIGLYDTNIAVEDVDFMLRALRKFRIKAIPKVWILYRKHGENWSMTGAGLKKIIDSELLVARKQSWFYCLAFVYFRVPIWFLYSRVNNFKYHSMYCIFLPFYFINKKYMYNFIYMVFGRKSISLLKRFV